MRVTMLIYATEIDNILEQKSQDLSLRKSKSETYNPFLKINLKQKRGSSEEKNNNNPKIKEKKIYSNPMKKKFKKDNQYKSDLGFSEGLRSSFQAVKKFLTDQQDFIFGENEFTFKCQHFNDDYFIKNQLCTQIKYHENINLQYLTKDGKEGKITRLLKDDEIYQYLKIKLMNIDNNLLFVQNLTEILDFLKFHFKQYKTALKTENLIVNLFSFIHPELIITTTKIKQSNLINLWKSFEKDLLRNSSLPKQEDITEYSKSLLKLRSNELWYKLENFNEIEKYCADQFLFNIVGTTDFYSRKRTIILNFMKTLKDTLNRLSSSIVDNVKLSIQQDGTYSIPESIFLELSKILIVLSRVSKITNKKINITKFLLKAHQDIDERYEEYMIIKYNFENDLMQLEDQTKYFEIQQKLSNIENNFNNFKNFNKNQLLNKELCVENLGILQTFADGYKFFNRNEPKLTYKQGAIFKKNQKQSIKCIDLVPQNVKAILEKDNNTNQIDLNSKNKRKRTDLSIFDDTLSKEILSNRKNQKNGAKWTRMLMELITEYKPSPKKKELFETISKKIHKEPQEFHIQDNQNLQLKSNNTTPINKKKRIKTQNITNQNNIDFNFKDSSLVINNSKIDLNPKNNFNKKRIPIINNNLNKKNKTIQKLYSSPEKEKNKTSGYDCLDLDATVQEKISQKTQEFSQYYNMHKEFQNSYLEVYFKNLVQNQQYIEALKTIENDIQSDIITMLLSQNNISNIGVFIQALSNSMLQHKQNLETIQKNIEANMQQGAKDLMKVNETYEGSINNFKQNSSDLQQILQQNNVNLKQILQK